MQYFRLPECNGDNDTKNAREIKMKTRLADFVSACTDYLMLRR